MTADSAPWYKSFFFGSGYEELYRGRLSEKRTKEEAACARELLELQPGDSVLDLCCGQGRHSVELAQQGFKVTGLDLNRDFLARATTAANEAGTAIETVAADMRDIPFSDTFDAVISLFTSFGYLESDAEDLKVLEAVRKALKPGGRVLLDVQNREWTFRDHITKGWHRDMDGTAYLWKSELDLQTSRATVSFEAFYADGRKFDFGEHTIRYYSLTELLAMTKEAGLKFESVSGGYRGQPYDLVAERMIVVARRPA